MITTCKSHGINIGDIVVYTMTENRRWMRLWYRITFRNPDYQMRVIEGTVKDVTQTTFNIK